MSYHWGLGESSSLESGLQAGKECLEKVASDAKLSEAEFERCAKASAYAGAAAYCTAQAGPVMGEICGEAAGYIAGKLAGPAYKTGKAIINGVQDFAGDIFGGGSGCSHEIRGKCWTKAFTPAQQYDECLRMRREYDAQLSDWNALSLQARSRAMAPVDWPTRFGCATLLQTFDATYGQAAEDAARAADKAYMALLTSVTNQYNEVVQPRVREVMRVAKELGRQVDLGVMGGADMSPAMAEVLGRDLLTYAVQKDRSRLCGEGPCPVFAKADVAKLLPAGSFKVPVTFKPGLVISGIGDTGITGSVSGNVVRVQWNHMPNPTAFRSNPTAYEVIRLWARGIEVVSVELQALVMRLGIQWETTLALWQTTKNAQSSTRHGIMLLLAGGALLLGASYLATRKKN